MASSPHAPAQKNKTRPRLSYAHGLRKQDAEAWPTSSSSQGWLLGTQTSPNKYSVSQYLVRWAQSLVKERKRRICKHVLQHEMGSISILERSQTHSGHCNKARCSSTFGNWHKPKNKSTKYICRDGLRIINKSGQGKRMSFQIKPKLNKDKTPGSP